MLDSSLFVATGAVGRCDRRGFVNAMASRTVGRGMLFDRCRVSVTLRMAVDALRLGAIGCEKVAGQTPRGLAPRSAAMGDRGLLGMAARAHRSARILEPLSLERVAGAARHVGASDVGLVPRAPAELRPCRGHEAGRHWARPAVQPVREHSDHGGEHHCGGHNRPRQDARTMRHGPAPWHWMQGWSWCWSLRLENPGPCGLPPGPPTLWQPTQSCSFAPPWQPAQVAGSSRALGPCSPPLGVSHPGG